MLLSSMLGFPTLCTHQHHGGSRFFLFLRALFVLVDINFFGRHAGATSPAAILAHVSR